MKSERGQIRRWHGIRPRRGDLVRNGELFWLMRRNVGRSLELHAMSYLWVCDTGYIERHSRVVAYSVTE